VLEIGAKIQTVVYRLTGKTPLLCNNPESMKQGNSGMGTKHIPLPEEEAKSKLYLDSDGNPVFPVVSPRNSMVQSAKTQRMKIGKQSAASVMLAAFLIPEEFIPILNAKTGKPATNDDWVIDTRTAVVGKARVWRSRPKFEHWMMDVPFMVDTSLVLGCDLIDAGLQLLEAAGTFVGIGDFRPHKGGMFGRFSVKIRK
jgi:hypothetical protein